MVFQPLRIAPGLPRRRAWASCRIAEGGHRFLPRNDVPVPRERLFPELTPLIPSSVNESLVLLVDDLILVDEVVVVDVCAGVLHDGVSEPRCPRAHAHHAGGNTGDRPKLESAARSAVSQHGVPTSPGHGSWKGGAQPSHGRISSLRDSPQQRPAGHTDSLERRRSNGVPASSVGLVSTYRDI